MRQILESFSLGNLKPLLVIIIIILFAMLIFLIFLIFNKRKTKKQAEAQEIAESSELERLGGAIKKSDAKKALFLFDNYLKNFFRNFLKKESEMNYAEIAKELKRKNKYALANFCEKIEYYLYSKFEDKISKQDVIELKNEFENLK